MPDSLEKYKFMMELSRLFPFPFHVVDALYDSLGGDRTKVLHILNLAKASGISPLEIHPVEGKPGHYRTKTIQGRAGPSLFATIDGGVAIPAHRECDGPDAIIDIERLEKLYSLPTREREGQ